MNTHTVLKNLKRAQLLSLSLRQNVIISWQKFDKLRVASLQKFDIACEQFVAIRMQRKYRHKEWSKQCWIVLSKWLYEKGINTVFTGTDAEKGTAGMDAIYKDLPGRVFYMTGKFNTDNKV